jgi:hypothetical protein
MADMAFNRRGLEGLNLCERFEIRFDTSSHFTKVGSRKIAAALARRRVARRHSAHVVTGHLLGSVLPLYSTSGPRVSALRFDSAVQCPRMLFKDANDQYQQKGS